MRISRWLNWFVDDDDPFYSPWRGVALWLIVVGLIVAATFAASHFGWYDSGDGSGSCPPAWAAAGDC